MLRARGQIVWRSGFTLPEALAALVITATASTATFLAIGQSVQSAQANLHTTRGSQLAQELMAEIRGMRWADASQPSHWGPESGETDNANSRNAFDDVDDYDGWTGAPQTKSGTLYDTLQGSRFPNVTSHEYAAYTCSVKVHYVDAAGVDLTSGTSSYRKVTVTVARPGQPAYELIETFTDLEAILGSSHWYVPGRVEALATVVE